MFLGREYWDLGQKPNRQHFLFSGADEDQKLLAKKCVPQYLFIPKEF